MICRPKLRIVNSPTARAATTTTPIPNTTWMAAGSPLRKLQYPAAMPSSAIANRSRTRSMKTVPNVRDNDAVLLIFSRYAR